MSRRTLIVGNWKMNGMNVDGIALAKGVADKIKAVMKPVIVVLLCMFGK